MSEKKIKAVLFDLGDTILNFGRIRSFNLFDRAARLSYAYLKGLGQPVHSYPVYHFWNAWGLRFRFLISILTGNDFDSLEALQSYGQRQGFKLTEEQWDHLNWLWYEPAVEQSWTEPDLRETFTALQEQGLKLGIVSNTFVNGKTLDRHLEMAGVLEFFPMRIYSYQYEFVKPDKRIFLEAAKKIGERPENILFIGDKISKDVVGSVGVGMTPVLKAAYTNEGKKVPEGVAKIDDLSELPELIRKINGVDKREDDMLSQPA